MNRLPFQFGTHESNAIVRYAEVYAIAANTKSISTATNASPIVVTTTAAHGYVTGDEVVISGVGGNVAANGTWKVTVTSSTQLSLDGSTGSGSYTSGGKVGYAQPVQVKFLVWKSSPSTGDPKSYVTYGGPVRVGDDTTPSMVASGERIWLIRRTDSQRWEPIVSEKKRAIRGTWYSGTSTLQINNVYLLDSGTDPRAVPGDIAELVEVINVPGDTYSSGDKVYADYNDDLDRWEARPKGSTGTTPPPLRRFELTANKLRADATATAKFLDDAGNMIGSDETLYDPELIFSGRAADYVGTIDGFRGVALKRTDLGGLEADRWEIVAMEGFAEWVVLTYAGSPDNEWQLTSFGGNQWHYKRPVADGDAITVSDPLTTLVSPQDGDMLIAHLSNPDTDPPTYQERERRRAWVSGVGGGTGIATIHSVDSIDISIVGSDLKVKINYTSYVVDSAGTTGTGSVEDTLALTSKTINNPTSIELNDTGTTLESKLNYTPITAKFIDASDGTATNSNDSVPLTSCP